jgi:hypothetical protein
LTASTSNQRLRLLERGRVFSVFLTLALEATLLLLLLLLLRAEWISHLCCRMQRLWRV